MKVLPILNKLGLECRQVARGYANHPMTRRAPLSILVNMMGWQLKASILSGEHEVKWIAGTRLLVRRGMTGATGNVYYGLAEYHDMAFALHLLRPEDLFVDVGANVGAYSVLASGVCGSRVVALEPIQAAAKQLRANLALNGLHPRVEVIEACIGDREATVRMTCGFDTTNRVVSGGELAESANVEVPMKTLDQILEAKCPVLIKIDTEGHEGNVLLGSQRVLQAPSLLAVSVEGDGSKSYPSLDGLTIAGWMKKFGFDPVSYNGSSRTLSTNPVAVRMNNLLFARNIEECRHRLATARSVQVLGVQV